MSASRTRRLGQAVAIGLISLIAVVANGAESTTEGTPAEGGDTIDLTAAPSDESTHRVSVELELGGELLARDLTKRSDLKGAEPAKTDEAERSPLSVTANLTYDERALDADQSVRLYERAEAMIKSSAGARAPRLPVTRRLILAHRGGAGRVALQAADGVLTRTELDLIDIGGDARSLDRLLPTGDEAKAIELGGEWKVSTEAMAALLGLDSVAVCEVNCVLDEANKRYARFQLAGTVHGVVDAATTEFDVRAIGLFHRDRRQVTQLNLATTEKRAIGPATPGMEGTAKVRIKRRPVVIPSELSDDALAKLTSGEKTSVLALEAGRQGFRVQHDRDWFIAGETSETVTLRRVDADGLTAQTTLRRLPPKAEQRLPTPASFEKEIRQSLGAAFGNLVSSEHWTNQHGCRVMGLVVQGKAQGALLEWRYYLVMPAAPGEQAAGGDARHLISIATTVERSLTDRVGATDRQLADQLELMKPDRSAVGVAAVGPIEGQTPRAAQRGALRTANRATGSTVR